MRDWGMLMGNVRKIGVFQIRGARDHITLGGWAASKKQKSSHKSES